MPIRVLRDGAGVLALGLALAGLLYGITMLARPVIDEKADLYALNRPAAYTFVDHDGRLIGHHGPIVGDRVKLASLPPYVPAAFLAMEDRNFYAHEGVDPRGLLRAFMTNVEARDNVQGGSTITQQLVKILFLTPERTYERKFRELGGAWTLERKLSKNQILELYLNRIYLGSGAYGIDGASRLYFNKPSAEVTLSEAAMLAALTRSPSVFTPRRDLAGAQARASLVLDAMVETRAITAEQARAAKQKPATIADSTKFGLRNSFFDAAADEVRRLLPETQGDLTVLTTFDPAMQKEALAAVESILGSRGKAMSASQAALVSMSTDGAIRALIGGRDYSESQFNRVTQAKRQPGSSFKVFVYLAALEKGLSPWDVRDDSVVTAAEGYAPDNYDNRHYGVVTIRVALMRSLNTVAIKLQQEVGARAVVGTAKRLGITSPLTQYASLALGTSEVTPLELTAAYAAFPADGLKVNPYSVLEVKNPHGEVLYRRSPPRRTRVIDEDKVLTMNAMLYDVVQHGTGRGAILSDREVAGKTGTSSEFRDAWFIGFTSDVVTGVWVGNDDFKPMRKVTGGTLPAQIWKTYMTAAVRNTPPVALAKALPEPEPNYAAYGDYGAQTQDGSNGFFIEVPGFIRDLFGSDDGSGDGRDLDRARERVREMNGRTEDRMQYEDPYAADARVPPPPPSPPPQNFATPQPTWNEDLFTAPPPRDLEAERRRLAERDQAFRAPYNPYMVPQPPPPPAAYRAPMPRDLPPIDRFGPSDLPPVDRPDDFAARSSDVPDRDVYQRDLDPGYYQNDVPPLPPPPIDPPFNWTR